MLNQRTNLLLSDDDYRMLFSLAKEKKTTMGDLIRRAVRKTYKAEREKSTAQLFKEMRAIVRKTKLKGLSYKEIKESIEYGRRY